MEQQRLVAVPGKARPTWRLVKAKKVGNCSQRVPESIGARNALSSTDWPLHPLRHPLGFPSPNPFASSSLIEVLQ